MLDKNKNFHNLAIKSILFKGRSDWYFCFLKSERIAHVLAVLSESVPDTAGELHELSRLAGVVPKTIVHFAAGEVDPASVLADLFSLVSTLRLMQTAQTIGKENSALIIEEYELLIEKFTASVHLSPFASADDFALPEIEQNPPLSLGSRFDSLPMQRPSADFKGHVVTDNKGQKENQAAPGQKNVSKEQQDRAQSILVFVQQNKGVSIKDIRQKADPVVRTCSEKTIQRELNVLVRQGHIKKVGERRWSLYLPA